MGAAGRLLRRDSKTGEEDGPSGGTRPRLFKRLRARRRRRKVAPHRLWWLLLPGLIVVALAAEEIVASRLQARLFARLGQCIVYRVEPGPSPSCLPPATGPYDQRLGYARLPEFMTRLGRAGYRVEEQARVSPVLQKVRAWGLFPVYREKSQAGLQVLDRLDRSLYRACYPARVYEGFETVPPLVVATLLFIENRDALDGTYPQRNPAVDWSRLGRALGLRALSVIDGRRKAIGGSTLATQIEKFRHSPEGRTTSGRDKLRQMVSASLRAYQEGQNTLQSRRRIVLDYLNSVPLAAAPGYGEVSGLGDGLLAWFGRDFDEVNRLLTSEGDWAERALAFKQVLSLFLSQRRPSYYLNENREALGRLCDSYLRLLANEGVISPTLRDLALSSPLSFGSRTAPPSPLLADRKGANVLRGRLTAQLGLPSLYELDRLDMTVQSTLDAPSQQAATRMLKSLADPEFVAASGLRAQRLLAQGDPAGVTYAFTLYERGKDANVIRIQTDSLDQPLDLNDGMKLDLGSTAKLRTLVTYLEIVAELHRRYASTPKEELGKIRPEYRDKLTVWAVSYLAGAEDRSLPAMLEAALDRRYSASPGEAFFTGGGLHTFSNFKREDNGRILPLREALRHSVNLVFIRLMRDVVQYYIANGADSPSKLLRDGDDPRRMEYLRRFADAEGSEFLRRIYRRHQGRTPAESLELVASSIRPTPERLATVLRSWDPAAGPKQLSELLAAHAPAEQPSDSEAERLLAKYSPSAFSLMDRGYLAGVHPLELWLLGYLHGHPGAGLSEVLSASAAERQEVYGWLFKSSRKHAQDQRISTMVELEAFERIHASWQRLGYPFAYLTPSLATAIGSSGDRPSALAELMGILVNDGVRLPSVRAARLRFGAGTPYETTFVPEGKAREQVLAPEVARAVRKALLDVVEEGTAQRLKRSLGKADGSKRMVGGKTGTGDERFERYGPGHQLVESRFVSRAAVFVFFVDERFFGVLTAYVHGPESGRYGFTSALPVQVLGLLMPSLSPLLDGTTPPAVPPNAEPKPAGQAPALAVALPDKRSADIPDASATRPEPPQSTTEKASTEAERPEEAEAKLPAAAEPPKAAAAKLLARPGPAKKAVTAEERAQKEPSKAAAGTHTTEPNPHKKAVAVKLPAQPEPAKKAVTAKEPAQKEPSKAAAGKHTTEPDPRKKALAVKLPAQPEPAEKAVTAKEPAQKEPSKAAAGRHTTEPEPHKKAMAVKLAPPQPESPRATPAKLPARPESPAKAAAGKLPTQPEPDKKPAPETPARAKVSAPAPNAGPRTPQVPAARPVPAPAPEAASPTLRAAAPPAPHEEHDGPPPLRRAPPQPPPARPPRPPAPEPPPPTQRAPASPAPHEEHDEPPPPRRAPPGATPSVPSEAIAVKVRPTLSRELGPPPRDPHLDAP